MAHYEFDYGPNYNNNTKNKRPTVIRLTDRCWCDFSSGSFFEPFNVSAWEYASVKKFKKELLFGKEREAERDREREARGNEVESERDSENMDLAAATSTSPKAPTPGKGFESLRSVFWRAPPSAQELPDPSPSSFSTETPSKDNRRSIAPWEFDLEPYGFDLVLDLKWTRSGSTV